MGLATVAKIGFRRPLCRKIRWNWKDLHSPAKTQNDPHWKSTETCGGLPYCWTTSFVDGILPSGTALLHTDLSHHTSEGCCLDGGKLSLGFPLRNSILPWVCWIETSAFWNYWDRKYSWNHFVANPWHDWVDILLKNTMVSTSLSQKTLEQNWLDRSTRLVQFKILCSSVALRKKKKTFSCQLKEAVTVPWAIRILLVFKNKPTYNSSVLNIDQFILQ